MIVIDDAFALSVVHKIMNDDYEPWFITECHQRHDWLKWEEAIQAELTSLTKRDVYRPIARTFDNIKLVGYECVFIEIRNEKNEIVRYKTQLIAQGFFQWPGIDDDETYSPIMDTSYMVH